MIENVKSIAGSCLPQAGVSDCEYRIPSWLAIIAVVYEEPYWEETRQILMQLQEKGAMVVFVERSPKGYGSLAEAINKGVERLDATMTPVTFVVTNITFTLYNVVKMLMDWNKAEYVGITPSFTSDHIHCRPDGSCEIKRVPFFEFTCPMVLTNILKEFPLDENMPFIGHDLDWSYRVQKAGYQIAVHHGVQVGHTYIRNNKSQHPITAKRYRYRKMMDMPTIKALKEKYGEEWRGIVFPKRPEDHGKFYEQVSKKFL